ncbi:MAG TPA: secretin N-terminal domain-containing protein, partial [Phycisphaerae bacterium]|nr:secretin N-terminal domain-containing protein [Phycisphaerae bacterium]
MQYLRRTQWIPWSLAVICLTATWAVAQPKASSGATTKPKPDIESPVLEATRPNGLKIAARDADLRAVLQMLSAQGKMNIIATKEVSGKVTVDLHDVSFQEALEAVLESSGFVHRQKGNFIYIYTPSQLEKILSAERKKVVRSFRLAYIGAKDAKSLITPALSKDGSIAVTPDLDVYQMGGGSSSGSSGGGSSGGGGSSTDAPTNYASSEVLVIQDYEDNMKHIEKIVQEIDVKPEQVLIEATILQATLNDNNALGIDFTSLAGVDFRAFSPNTASPAPPGFNTPADTHSVTPSGAMETNFAANVPAGGMSVGVLTNNIAFFIRALERVTDTTVLANPKLLVVNKQKGEVLIGRSDGYIASTTQTETSATATVEFLDSGIRLAVRPFVGKDGYIRMQIHPEDSDGRVIQVGNTALPTKTTTEVTSNVMVRDGHTIVLGGLFRERTVTSRSQVPLVGNVPYVGTLFRSTVDETVREEIIVLLTPRIINQDVDEAVGDQIAEGIRLHQGLSKRESWNKAIEMLRLVRIPDPERRVKEYP